MRFERYPAQRTHKVLLDNTRVRRHITGASLFSGLRLHRDWLNFVVIELRYTKEVKVISTQVTQAETWFENLPENPITSKSVP
ncbi:hypothetical protein KIN20_028694 [Parelaphostrongylus tenuis]|uniref:Uncharacterized protein n=1 Tax=Parelaphostrongylus tenuis TaxID=148309 RepID=A0AAD5R1I7_PARTN|nr:hypothetical protein KIN20_028694 [Parelaphostrongylus tenuis]